MITDSYSLERPEFSDEEAELSAYDAVIENVYSTLNSQLMKLFDNMVKTATGKLVILDSQQFSYENQDDYDRISLEREAIRYLLRDSKNISTIFFIKLNEQLYPGSQNITNSKEELSLVSHEEMEEMVAITTMHANALNDFGDCVSQLNARIEYLEINDAAIFSSKALSPKAICEAYQKTLNEQNVGTKINLVLFKLFDDEVNQKLKSMYTILNQIFIDADIMPEVLHTSYEHDVLDEDHTFKNKTVDYYDAQENKQSNFIPRSQQDLNDIVSQFTRGDINVTSNELDLPPSFYKDPAQQNNDGKQYYPRKDVVRSLNRLQKKLMDQGSASGLNNTEEIKRSLMDDVNHSNEGEAKEVSVLDERNMDFVGMVFNAISADESISYVIMELVSQLQIPVIKVAMNDEQLFQDETHPTRKVLDLIPKAGKGVTDKKDHLYGKIEHVVNDILAEHDIEVASFIKAVDALYKIIHHEEGSAEVNEKEEKRQIIKEHARAVVVKEMKKNTAGKYVPIDVQPLILKHWSTLMLNRYIQHGNESEAWFQSIEVLKLLMDVLQPVEDILQWEKLKNNHSVLTEIIYDELYDTQQDRLSIDIQIASLKHICTTMIDAYEQFVADEESMTATTYAALDSIQREIAEYDESVASIIKEEEHVVEKVARLPTYVKPGTWFEIYTGEDQTIRRLKMSVILIETGKIVFVDRKGIKVLDKDAGEFADELLSNKSRLIADHSTFDNALGKVISAMAA